MVKVGSIEDVDGEYVIHRGFFRQGLVFKDEEAYRYRKDAPCYSPETSDAVYTGNDFAELCNCQEDFADELFEGVDWQHPESLKEDWIENGEWVVCKGCGRIINYGNGCNDTRCPKCGREVEE